MRGVNHPGSGWMTCGWCESGHHERCRRYMRSDDEAGRCDILCACAETGHAESRTLFR